MSAGGGWTGGGKEQRLPVDRADIASPKVGLVRDSGGAKGAGSVRSSGGVEWAWPV